MLLLVFWIANANIFACAAGERRITGGTVPSKSWSKEPVEIGFTRTFFILASHPWLVSIHYAK